MMTHTLKVTTNDNKDHQHPGCHGVVTDAGVLLVLATGMKHTVGAYAAGDWRRFQVIESKPAHRQYVPGLKDEKIDMTPLR